ncbi:MAG TPA: hypothetical protein DCZ76_01725 [Treponema sp.]|nr:hypothetical protein [Treponema sp.]
MKKLLVFIDLLLVLALSLLIASCGGGGGGGGSDEAESSPAPAAPALSSNAEIVSFIFARANNPAIANANGIGGDLSGNSATEGNVATVTVTYPFNSLTEENLKTLKPTILVSEGARISPASGVAQDFTNPVDYTVTAQDGSTKVWTVSVTERSASERSITYNLNGGEMKVTPPNVYNVEVGATLPSGGNLVKDNYYFTGWTNLATTEDISSWGAYGQTEDIRVKANWSPAPCVKDRNIYANGMNVTVKKNSNKTMVYFRGANGNEIALSSINAANEYQDLTGYTLYAGGLVGIDNGVTATDCTITMESGSLSNIYGYNGNGTNLSGRENVIIHLKGGIVTNDVVGFVNGASGKPENMAVKVSGNPTVGDKTDNGIWLNSFSSPVVTLTGSISSANVEAITIIAAGETQNGTHIAESAGSDYADAGKFKLLKSTPSQGSLTVGKSGSYVVVFGNVELPAVADWQGTDTFKLGSDNILQGGTYFSVFVDGGYFTVHSTTLAGAEFDMAIPYSTEGKVTYIDGSGLSTEGQYQYIQFKSTSGEISSTVADAYLAGIVFHGTSVKVSVNLQTVPFDEIQSSGVTYFNGSFYKVVTFPGNDKSWDTAYAAAKASTFNGLHGYLMTITSHVENKFIYDRVYAKNPNITPDAATGWIGATRGINKSGNYDASTWSFASSMADGSGNERAGWYWACGPEAGQQFYNTRTASSTGRVSGMYSSWNNPYDIPENGISGVSAGAEPNNSGKDKEYCAQYVGTYVWNDLSHSKSGAAGTYIPGSYIIEYSVYKNAYNEEKATSTALADSKTYTHP